MNDKIERLKLAAEDAAGGLPSAEQVDALIAYADALEAELAARQPSEEGEYILRLIETIKQTGGSVEIHGVKIMPCDEFGRTAAVPDAATEEHDPKNLSIMNGWLVEEVGEHTCGTGPDGYYGAHEPGCGYEPLVNLSELPGYPDEEKWGVALGDMTERAQKFEAERDAALEAIERVAALHVESDWKCGNPRHTNPDVGCPECYTECETCDRTYPCDTLAALDGAPEPETLELFPGTNAAIDRLTVRKAADANAFCIEHGNFHAVELGDPTCEFEDGFGEPVDGEQP